MNAPAITIDRRWHHLADLGFSTFPVEFGGKRPLGPWKRWQSERADLDTITNWATYQTNIGIATGAVSGLLVLDLDTPEAITEAKALGLPDTVTVTTGKGLHVYFRHPGGEIGNRAGIKPGWDIRGDGGYVVAPGSVHPSGAHYEWDNPPGLFDLAQAPDWLAELLEARKAQSPQNAAIEAVDHPYALSALEGECEAIRRAANGAQESTVNASALKIGHYVGSEALSFDTARSALLCAAMAMHSHDARNPWADDPLANKIDRALRDGMAQPKAIPDRMRFTSTTCHDPETGELIEDAERPASAFRFIAVGDLEYRAPEYLIADLIETETLGLVFGDPGCGKSFVATDMGLSVATGTPFHGRKVKQGAVYLIAGEGHNGLTRRFAAWAKHNGVSIKSAPLFMSNRPAQFLDHESATAVAEAVRQLAAQHGNPALILIDTLARNYGPGDENSTSDMGAFIAVIDDLKAQFPGCTVLIVHHSGHGDKQRARGAMALKGALDCEYRVEKADSLIRLVNTKMKDAEPPNPLAFDLTGVDLGSGASSAVLVETDAPERPRQLSKTQALARDTFVEAARDCADFAQVHLETWQAAFLCRHTGDNDDSKKRAFRRARGELVDARLLSVIDDIYRAECPTIIARLQA